MTPFLKENWEKLSTEAQDLVAAQEAHRIRRRLELLEIARGSQIYWVIWFACGSLAVCAAIAVLVPRAALQLMPLVLFPFVCLHVGLAHRRISALVELLELKESDDASVAPSTGRAKNVDGA